MAITPATYDLKVQRRADYVLTVQFKEAGGSGMDLTGWQVLAQVWDKNRLTKYGDFTSDLSLGESGNVTLTLSHTVTASLPTETRWDVMLISPAGLREYYLEGAVLASEGYTAPVEL